MGSRNLGGWAVVNTHTHKEVASLQHLRRQGYQAYCPVIAKRIRHARKYQTVARPLFPGYVFVALDLMQSWRPLLSTVGVRNLIRSGDAPKLLHDRFIESLRAREIEGVIVQAEARFSVGQRVQLTGGSYFDGVMATILELSTNDRVAVLLQLLNGEVRAQVSTAQLVALDETT